MEVNFEEIKAFLENLRRDGPWTISAIRLDALPGSEVPTRTLTTIQAAFEWVRAWHGTHNIYYQANRMRADLKKKGRLEDIEAVEYIHVDIDKWLGENLTDDTKAEVVERIMAYRAPAFINDSGNGIQALWRLAEPITDISIAERMCAAIRADLDGDKRAWRPCAIL
jgi:hypothetical protein